MSAEHWIVGSEHGQALFAQLGTSLRALGYRLGNEWSGVGGSQDISHWEVSGPEGSLVVEAETYVGLSVSGPKELVLAVKRHFTGVLPANNSLQGRRP
jgi:hypothetical protein